MADLSMLIDMGFSKSKAEKALDVTGHKGVEAAMEWLLAHGSDIPDSEDIPAEITNTSDNFDTDTAPTAIEVDLKTEGENSENKALSDDVMSEAKCIKCEECNKKFKTDSEIEFHAVKTGHQNFSESTEEIKPLSEEEKKEQMKKLESIIKQRRIEKAEQEKKEALEREKNRRKTGQELISVRQKLQEEEIKQLAELKRQEKLEAKLARQRVLEEIERDKQARKEKFANVSSTAVAPPPPPVNTIIPPLQPVTNQNFDECRLQIRLTNGQCLTEKFSPNEQLAAVRLYIEMNRTDGSGPFSLMTNFPRKVYTESDMHSSLNTLGLVPSAVLIVSKQQ